MKTSRVVLLVLAAVLVVGVVVVGRVGYVRTQYGEWGIAPSDAPPRLHFGGREYRRGAPSTVPAGDVVVGHVGGGDLYGPRNWPDAPTVLELRTPAGVTGYDLVGGP